MIVARHDTIDLASYLHRAARARPKHVAISSERGNLTYQALSERVMRLANGLKSIGIQAGDRVAVLLPNGPAFVESYFAIVALGAVAVPLNLRLASSEHDFLLADCEPSALIADGAALRRAALDVPDGTRVISVGKPLDGTTAYDRLITQGDPHLSQPCVDLSRAASILYTSGTTGRPKGIVRTQRAASYIIPIRQAVLRIGPETTLLATTPMFHAAGHEFMMFQTLMAGGRVVTRAKFDEEEVLSLFDRERITHAFFVPTMSERLLNAAEAVDCKLDSLSMWVSAAAPLPGRLRDRILERMPWVDLWNVYGVTEAGVATYLRTADLRRKPPACTGLPGPGAEIRIAGEHGSPVTDDTVGEILVRSPEAMVGYWNRPTESEAALAGGWVHTGDLGAFDDEGFLNIVGRLKDMIISGGENVYAAEVEGIMGTCELLRDVAIIGVPHREWGEAVVAVIVPSNADRSVEDAVIAFTKRRLASYKCPKRVVAVDELPRNGFGKVMKDVLKDQYSDLFAGAR